jgi:hypothetical protein
MRPSFFVGCTADSRSAMRRVRGDGQNVVQKDAQNDAQNDGQNDKRLKTVSGMWCTTLMT